MIRVSKAHCREGIVRDRVGKVYRLVSINGVLLRKCLVCEEMFPREVCAEHSQAACGPRTRRDTNSEVAAKLSPSGAGLPSN
jgi:hypothetical protein